MKAYKFNGERVVGEITEWHRIDRHFSKLAYFPSRKQAHAITESLAVKGRWEYLVVIKYNLYIIRSHKRLTRKTFDLEYEIQTK